MKSRIFWLVISLAAAIGASACYTPIFKSQDMQVFRATPGQASSDTYHFNNDRTENIKLWLRDVGAPSLSADDVEAIVYKSTLAGLKSLSTESDNPFARILLSAPHHDAYSCLLLAKEVEEIRQEMADPWYYPVRDDSYHVRMDTLLDLCHAGMEGPMAPRYCVQAMRIYMACGDYDKIIDFWNKHQHKLPDNVLRRMAADYAGGAYEHLADPTNAKRLYTESQNLLALSLVDTAPWLNDPDSIFMLKVREIENVFSVYPNHPLLREKVQSVVYDFESAVKGRFEFVEFDNDSPAPLDSLGEFNSYLRLCDFAEKAAVAPGVESPAFWYYTAAYIRYLRGEMSKSSRLLRKAENARAIAFDRESIRVLRFLFDIDTRDISRSEYLSFLQWAEPKMIAACKSYDDEEFDIWWLKYGYSSTFWCDVVRKVCARAADSLKAKGDLTLALMMSNYGCYAPLPYLKYKGYIYDAEKDDYDYKVFDYAQMREFWDKSENDYDYSNSFFALLDSVTPTQAAAFARRVAAPQDALERFILKRGYFDKDYIYDHVGTLYLRDMDYASAVNWLRRVSCAYQQRTNVRYYMKFDPFEWLDVDHLISDSSDYKLRFARKMLELQQQIASERDPDRRANARINFAIGLRNSFGRCWALNYYSMGLYEGCLDYSDVFGDDSLGLPRISSQRNAFSDKQSKRAYDLYDRYVALALKEFTSDELIAQAQLRMKNFKTLMSDYPDTYAARFVASHCDTYYDYAIQKY